MRENVIIAYRGANYELGQWPHGYGIWSVSNEESLPLEWWDPTPEGWSAAWYRFAALEGPGSIASVGPPGPASSAPAAGPGPAGAPVPVGVASTADAEAPAGASALDGGPGAALPLADEEVIGDGPTEAVAAAGAGQWPAPFLAPAGPYPGQHFAAAQAPAVTASPTGMGPGPAGPHNAGAGTTGTSSLTIATAVSAGRSRLAGTLLAAGVVLGVIGLFPGYQNGVSLSSAADNLWPHLIYLAGWAVAAVMLFRSERQQRTGALLAVGISVVTLGLFLADAGFAIAGASNWGTGLVISLIAWAACAAGSAVAFGRWPAGWPRRPLAREAGVVTILIAAAIGVAITFAPSWDKISLPTGTAGTLTETAGYAFNNPGAVIAGDVLVMVAIVAVAVVAALWRPARLGWALVAGALIPIAGQVVSALAQLGTTTTAADLGVTPAQASQLGISVSQPAQTSLTLPFWLYCLFALAMVIACAWLAFGRDEVAVPAPAGYGYGYGSPAGYGPPPPGYGRTGYGPPPGYGTSAGFGASGPTMSSGPWPGAPTTPPTAPSNPVQPGGPGGLAGPPDSSGPAGS